VYSIQFIFERVFGPSLLQLHGKGKKRAKSSTSTSRREQLQTSRISVKKMEVFSRRSLPISATEVQ
jgi:hypothetical protein